MFEFHRIIVWDGLKSTKCQGGLFLVLLFWLFCQNKPSLPLSLSLSLSLSLCLSLLSLSLFWLHQQSLSSSVGLFPGRCSVILLQVYWCMGNSIISAAADGDLLRLFVMETQMVITTDWDLPWQQVVLFSDRDQNSSLWKTVTLFSFCENKNSNTGTKTTFSRTKHSSQCPSIFVTSFKRDVSRNDFNLWQKYET